MVPGGGRVRRGHDGEVRGTARATAPGCAHRMLTGSRGWARLPWLPSPRMGLRRYSAKISRQLQPLWRRWLTLGGKLRTARQGVRFPPGAPDFPVWILQAIGAKSNITAITW